MAKRRDRGAGTVGKGLTAVVVVGWFSVSGFVVSSAGLLSASVLSGVVAVMGSSGWASLSSFSFSDGAFSSPSFVRLRDDKPCANRDATRGSGGGTRSHRTCVGCMILGYCMELVWMS